jgi:hypothetical protein
MGNFWKLFVEILNSLLGTKSIDWEDPQCPITKNFVVKEALWLPRWNRLANEEDGLTKEHKNNLVVLFKQMELVRSFLNKPIVVNVAYRPPEYNRLIEGAEDSAHLYGMAVDWYVSNMSCDDVRSLIVPHLEKWKLRCENASVNWIHTDIRPPIFERYFKP